MGEGEHRFNGMSYSIVKENPNSNDRSARKHKKKKEKKTVKNDENLAVIGETPTEANQSNYGTEKIAHAKRQKAASIEEKQEIDRVSPSKKRKLNGEGGKRRKSKRREGLLNESNKIAEEQIEDGGNIADKKNPLSSDVENGEEQYVNLACSSGEEKLESCKEKSESRRSKKKQRLLEEAAKADQRGICYLSRIPPHMDPVKLRQILSQYGEIQRIYLAPEGDCYLHYTIACLIFLLWLFSWPKSI